MGLVGTRSGEKTGVAVAMRYFEDITEGDRLDCRPVSISKEAVVRFAAEFDPQPFHVDEGAARSSIFGGLIASSLHTLSACTRSIVEAQGQVAVLSGVGMDEVRMFNPVRPGDVLNIEACWVDLKRSRSKPDRGFAGIKCKVFNQRGEPVMEYGYQYLVSCRTGPCLRNITGGGKMQQQDQSMPMHEREQGKSS